MLVMAETTATPTPKPKPKPVAVSAPIFEMPKFEIPKFEMPNMEVPAAFREFAEKGVAQAKENYEKMKSTAEDATKVLEDSYATASKGCSGYGLKLIETARTNSNAAFDMLTELMGAKSFAEGVELYTGFLREQFDTITAQTKELGEHAQKVATETAEPIKESFTTAFSKAA
jgi:phasin